MRCRSYPKTLKPSITTPNTPSSTRKITTSCLAPDTSDEQLLPANESLDEFSDQAAGKRAANLSLLFGFLSPLSFFLGFWCLVQGLEESALQVAILAPILNILGIWQGFAARRRGTRASGGLILNGLGLCIFIGIAALIMLIVNALSGIN